MVYKHIFSQRFMITGLLVFYVIIGLLAVGGALLTYAVVTKRHEKDQREQHGH